LSEEAEAEDAAKVVDEDESDGGVAAEEAGNAGAPCGKEDRVTRRDPALDFAPANDTAFLTSAGGTNGGSAVVLLFDEREFSSTTPM
jgi:hypothetical protein